jgi:formyltetrahydrofolate-dependent phosphoribosylglycinamide formyltransferase
MMRRRVGVLISGRGSNLQALIDAQGSLGTYEIVLVVSNVAGVQGLERAAAAGIETAAIEHKSFGKDREAFERALDARLRAANVELVALAGFMRLLTGFFVGAWANRLINIHPSLLPSFPGLNTHARAIDAGAKLAGCTVHWVTEGVDAGPIVGQAAVPVYRGDTPATLAARTLDAEHVLFPACLALVCGGEAVAPLGAQPMLLNAF